PELLTRALYFFRWGAAFTWITGVILLGMVYYMYPSTLIQADGIVDSIGGASWACVALVFVSPFIYDFLASGPLKNPTAGFWGGWVLATAMYFVFHHVGHCRYLRSVIHVGAMLAPLMAYVQ